MVEGSRPACVSMPEPLSLAQRLQITAQLKAAHTLQAGGDLSAARAKYTELLDQNAHVLPAGDLSEIYDRRGRCCERAGDLVQALADFCQAIGVAGARHSLLLHRARLLCHLGRWTEAHWDLSVAVTLQPQHVATQELLRRARLEAQAASVRLVFSKPSELGLGFSCVPDPLSGLVRELRVTEVAAGSQANDASPPVQLGWRVVAIGGTMVNKLAAAEALGAMSARPLALDFEMPASTQPHDPTPTEVGPQVEQPQSPHRSPERGGAAAAAAPAAAPAARTIHYAFTQHGSVASAEVPVTQLRSLIATGEVSSQTPVWASGMDDWLPLEECADAFGIVLASSPDQPPIPPRRSSSSSIASPLESHRKQPQSPRSPRPPQSPRRTISKQPAEARKSTGPNLSLELQLAPTGDQDLVSERWRRLGGSDKMLLQIKQKLRAVSYAMGGQDPSKLFKLYDRDNSGELDGSEFASAIRKGGHVNAAMMANADLDRLFTCVDIDGSGNVSIDEMAKMVWGDSPGIAAPAEYNSYARLAKRLTNEAQFECLHEFYLDQRIVEQETLPPNLARQIRHLIVENDFETLCFSLFEKYGLHPMALYSERSGRRSVKSSIPKQSGTPRRRSPLPRVSTPPPRGADSTRTQNQTHSEQVIPKSEDAQSATALLRVKADMDAQAQQWRVDITKKALAKLRHAKVSSAFCAWTAHVKKMFRARCLLVRVADNSISRAFTQWVAGIYERKRLADLLSRVGTRLTLRVLHMALDGWRAHATAARRSKRIASRAVRHMAHKLVAPAWRRWCVYAADRARHHEVLVKAATRMTQRQLSHAFENWLEQLQRVRGVLRILTRQSNLSLGRALRQWHEFMQAEVYRQAVVHAYQSGVRASPFSAPPDVDE